MPLTQDLIKTMMPGKIHEVRVGRSRVAVLAETTNGELRCGMTATLSNPEYEHHTQPAVRNAGHLHEMSSIELAALSDSESYTEAAIGFAAINALLPQTPDQWVDLNANDYIAQYGAGKNVTLVGHFNFVKKLKPQVKNLWVLELNPQDGDYPSEAAPDLIPQSDVLAMTATTLINKTFEGLVKHCKPGTKVVMLGPTTPLSPIMYEYGVDVLSGTAVMDPKYVTLAISQGICLHQLHHTSSAVRLVTMQKGA